MKIDKSFLIIVGVVVATGVGLYLKCARSGAESVSNAPRVVVADGEKVPKTSARRQAKANRRKSDAVRVERAKPNVLVLDDDEESKLNDFSRTILRDLQAALDSNSFARVSKLVAKMLEIPPDPKFGKEGVAKLLRRKAIEALGWFGAQSLPELVGMLADPDPEIVDDTFEQFRLALEDTSLGDRACSTIVTMAAKVLTNTDHLEQLFMELNNMRNSVAAQTLVDICNEGTAQAKELMPETIQFITGEDNVTTIEDLEAWLANNPDSVDDEFLYGPDKDE